jgi:gamma-glutamylcyclotransferase
MHYYFAYGSNMNPDRVSGRQMDFNRYESGCLQGYRLAFNKRSVIYPGAASANVMQDAAGVVEGVVYHLSDEQQIETMDPFEGYPLRYDRCLLPVQTDDQQLNVWVYIANPDFIQEGLRPNRWYLNHLLAGRAHLSEGYYQTIADIQCLPNTDLEPAAR